MRIHRHIPVLRRLGLAAVAASAVMTTPPGLRAAEVGDAATRPAARPMLEQLNRETQDLYRSLGRSLVRVRVPQRAAALANSYNRWDQYPLDANVRDQLMNPVSQRRNAATTRPAAAAQPQAQQSGGNNLNALPPQQGVVIVLPNGGELPSNLLANNRAATPQSTVPAATTSTIGLVLDEQGHVLVPLYVEREAAAAQPARVVGGAGEGANATYVGSDAQTSLTVLRLAGPGGKAPADAAKQSPPANQSTPPAYLPIRLSPTRPAEGALMLYLSPTDGTGRLGVWAAAARGTGVVVGVDGQVMGVSRPGQFVSAAECRFVADGLIRDGVVKRATLGVTINWVEADDPLRAQHPPLGDRPAIRIDGVTPGSAADRGGLRPGDLILSFAGESAADVPSLAASVSLRDGKTPVRVLRGDQEMEVTVDLERK